MPVVKCPISIWLHTGQPLISCFYTCLNQQRKLLNFLMVGEQFDSINSIYTTVKCGKVGSKAADGLQLPFTYELVYVHPCHLTRTLIVKVFPVVVCTHAMHVQKQLRFCQVHLLLIAGENLLLQHCLCSLWVTEL